MPTPIPSPVALISTSQASFDQAEMAAAAYLARDGGRTLETYRDDLRTFFQWCSDVDLGVLEACGLTSSCGGPRWKSGAWRRRPSTDVSRRSVASTASPTSTAASRPTQPSTPVGPRSSRTRAVGSIAASSARSSSRPNATTLPMPPWPRSWG
jgi:hypothetical protein